MILKKLSSYHLLKANSYTCVQCPSPLQFSIFSFSLGVSTLLDPTLKTIIISRVFSSKRTSAICSLRSPSNYHPFIFLSLKGLLLYSSNYPSQITFNQLFVFFHKLSCGLLYSIGSSAWCCDDVEGWDGSGMGERFKREGTYVYLTAHSYCCMSETTTTL